MPVPLFQRHARAPQGFTLIEIMVATALMLFIMLVLVQIFSVLSRTASQSQNVRNTDQRANSAVTVIRNDLTNITVVLNPPRDPASGEGYFESSENSHPDLEGEDTDDTMSFTTRLASGTGENFQGRFGNLVFHTSPPGTPMAGAGTVANNVTIEHDTAEVSYFVRNGNLYRRQLLVAANAPTNWDGTKPWYAHFDVSARPPDPTLVAPPIPMPQINTLGDLTNRENRFAHDPRAYPPNPISNPGNIPYSYPFRTVEFLDTPVAPSGNGSVAFLHEDDDFNGNRDVTLMPPGWQRTQEVWFGRPLMRETSYGPDAGGIKWPWPDVATNLIASLADNTPANGIIDAFEDPLYVGPYPAQGDQRFSEDILITDVLSFDIELYDPGAPLFQKPNGELVPPGHSEYLNNTPKALVGFGAYVDLGYGLPTWPFSLPNTDLRFPGNWPVQPVFWHNGAPAQTPALRLLRTYDTWSIQYEQDSLDQDNRDGDSDIYTGFDEGTNGVDDNGNGLIDEAPNSLDDNGDGIVDDLSEQEWEAPPPYAAPLRGIQIKIRIRNPNSAQAREYTITHSFVN